ncbi:MAG TPA: acetyl-CoA carboxylase biotin carboxyl carrier protein subunit [Solirubrobacterales bacterium]|nr:acetyl-CoA carboxylase biotin carboxyl carrier protein subunit [Solirubrobacterales bacterium]
MPGKVLAIEVSEGDAVSEGDVLLVLESMKMELQISAPLAGSVAELHVERGQQVSQGDPLVVVDPDREEPT